MRTVGTVIKRVSLNTVIYGPYSPDKNPHGLDGPYIGPYNGPYGPYKNAQRLYSCTHGAAEARNGCSNPPRVAMALDFDNPHPVVFSAVARLANSKSS